MNARAFSDPGGEVVNAPIGTEVWAQRVRLEMQSIVKNLPKAPERFEGYVRLCQEHRAWTLMNRQDGGRFKTFEEFCEAAEPWGLGRPYTEIVPYLEALHGKRAVQLETVRPAQEPKAGPGRGNKTTSTESTEFTRDHTAPLLRAILRAPQPIQQLYRDGLIGQKVAAKLGPDRPSPEQAARIAEVTEAVRSTTRPAMELEKPRVQREVNERVREMLDQKSDPVAQIVRLASKLNRQQVERLRIALRSIVGGAL